MDYYSILGIDKTASPEQIKKAYRKLASQHHPDKGGDTSKFQKIQEAYATLSDPDKKNQYDNPNLNDRQFYGWHQDNININDIFGQMFNNRNYHRMNKQIMRASINVSFKDSYNGTNHVIKIQSQTGTKVIDITIPKGVNTGDQLKYENVLDNAILLVEFNVLPDLKFDRKGKDLYCNHSISVLDLITGTNFEFETVSGKKFQVNVRPRTQPYMHLRLPGQGMPIPNSNLYGDQFILLKPFIPDNIDDEIIDSILRSRTK